MMVRRKTEKIIIALEGIDGAGKTTLINRVINELDGEISIYRRTQKGILMDKFLSSRFMAKYRVLQIPFYIILSYINYLKFCCKKQCNVVIMDRCFLSNICYYFPGALDDEKILKKVCFPEINLYPEAIFVLDVSPDVGRKRDNNKKALNWLRKTRENYLHAANSILSKKIRFQIIAEDSTIEEKSTIVVSYIRERIQLWS